MSNPFLQALAAADKDRQSHHYRAEAQTRAHFATHPDCTRKILAMDRDGIVTRGETLIDVEARCRPGWFTTAMWKQCSDSGRPLESQRAQSEGYWYRIDDLSAESPDIMPAGTREAASLWKAALRIAEEVRQAEAVRKAEVQRKKLELAQLKREARERNRLSRSAAPRAAKASQAVLASYVVGV
jgi:hypothetical protein